jgi:anti-sigma regulatory factor (Ser/Thr protein kinase)
VPLGVSRTALYHDHRFDFPTRASVVLVTDGVVEIPGEPLENGLERLRSLAEAVPSGEELCDAVADGLTPREREDDIAIVVARLAPLPDVLTTSWPADAMVLAPMRHLLRRWLIGQGASNDDTYDITVAVQEACANAVEHAYAPGPAAFVFEAEKRGDAIVATVRDRGGWRDPRGVNRGRGLPMMHALVDDVQVTRDDSGTTVTLTRALRGSEPS